MAGRTLAAVRQGTLKLARHYAWLARTALCLIALGFRHAIDLVAIVTWALAAATFAAGLWQAAHPKPPEDLTTEIFPPQDPPSDSRQSDPRQSEPRQSEPRQSEPRP